MENKEIIYKDDVERIVNDPERLAAINAFHRNRKVKRQRKMLFDAVLFAAIALMFGVLGIYNLIVPWISFWVAVAVGMYAAFLFGRFFENGKCYGWK